MQLWRYEHAFEQFGQRYTLLRPLGSGGMADVCLARDERLQREVAVKVLKPETIEPHLLRRFLKEGELVASLRHLHIVRVYHGCVQTELFSSPTTDEEFEIPYIVMEYARGGDLKRRMRSGEAYDLAGTLDIFAQICAATAYAHEQNVIHRDIKPQNILFRLRADGREQVVLSDFGLAYLADDTHLSMPGAGTLAYMAPEQRRGKPQFSSDIFSLGAVLYQLCTGRLPFRIAHMASPLKPPPLPSSLNPLLPYALDEVILSALAEDPQQRPEGADLFWQEVQDALRSSAITTLLKGKQPTPLYSQDQREREPDKSIWQEAAPRRIQADNVLARSDASEDPEDGDPLDVAEVAEPPSRRKSRWGELRAPQIPVNSVQSPVPTEQFLSSFENDYRQSRKAPVPRALKSLTPDTIILDDRQTEPGQSAAPVSRARTRVLASALPANRGNGNETALYPAASRKRQGNPNKRSNGAQRRWLLPGIALLTTLLLGGVLLAYFRGPLAADSAATSLATVTLTPATQTVQDSYLITAANGDTNSAAHQVSLRTLSFTTPAQSQKVDATGQGNTPATEATGTLTFSNGGNANFTVNTNVDLQGPNGLIIRVDDPVTVPAGTLTTNGFKSAHAHVTTAGAKGNAAAGTLTGMCCTDAMRYTNSTDFTGGQDAKSYKFLQQSDVNSYVGTVQNSLTRQAQDEVKKQVRAGEQPIGQTRCNDPNVQADQKVGDNQQDVQSATVSVTVTCSAAVYDAQGAQRIAESLLTKKAQDTFPNYKLAGSVISTPQEPNNPNPNANTVNLTVTAQGLWYASISEQEKQEIARQLAGKTLNDARALVATQRGVSKGTIDFRGGDTLPSDVARIRVVVQVPRELSP